MRSNWKLYPIVAGIRLTNNTYYLPWVNNKGRYQGFAEGIAAHAPQLMRQELAKVRIVAGGLGGKELRVEYPHELSATARFTQLPERIIKSRDPKFYPALRRFGPSPRGRF